jgi:hypothetical protein
MKVRVNTYNSDQFAFCWHSQNTVDTCLLPDWALLDSPENDRAVKPIGFAKLFYTPLGAQIIRTLSYCEGFRNGQKILIVAWAVLSDVPACHFTHCSKNRQAIC